MKSSENKHEREPGAERSLKGFLAGLSGPEAAREFLPELSRDPARWTRYLEKTSLAPVFFHRIKSAGLCESIPEEMLAAAADAFDRSTAVNIIRQDEFFRIADIFHRHGIPAAPLKGAWLLKEIYSPIGIRPAGDTDVLVPRARFADAVRLLEESGYRNRLKFMKGNPPRYPCGMQFVFQGGIPLLLELHDNVVNAFEIKSRVLPPAAVGRLRADLYRSLKPVEWDGHHMYSLPLEFTLISIIYHHFTHAFIDNIWFLDMVLLAKKGGGARDPAAFSEMLNGYGMGNLSFLYFEKCEALWPGPAALYELRMEVAARFGGQAGGGGAPACDTPIRRTAVLSSPAAFPGLALKAAFVGKTYFEVVEGRHLSAAQYLSRYAKHLVKMTGLGLLGDSRHLRELPRGENRPEACMEDNRE